MNASQKLNFPFVIPTAFIYSLVIHVVILGSLLSFKLTQTQSTSVNVSNIISAKLFYKTPTISSDTNKQQSVAKHNQPNQVKAHTLPPSENTNENLANSQTKDKISQDSVDNSTKSSLKADNTPTKKFSPLTSLQSLRKNIDKQTYNQSVKEGYKTFVNSKNFIPKSTTKLNKLPEPKAVKIEVNCDNAFNEGLSIISGFLGGSIKCNSFNGSQQYIDARLERLGKKTNKNKLK